MYKGGCQAQQGRRGFPRVAPSARVWRIVDGVFSRPDTPTRLPPSQTAKAASADCTKPRTAANANDRAAGPAMCLEEIPPFAPSSRSSRLSNPVGAAVGAAENALPIPPRSPSNPVGAALLSDGAIVSAVPSNIAGDGKEVMDVPEPPAVGAAVGGENIPREPGEGAAVGSGNTGVGNVGTVGATGDGVAVAGVAAGVPVVVAAGASVASIRPAVTSSHVVKSSQPNWSSKTQVSRSSNSSFWVLQPMESIVTHMSAYSSPHSSNSTPPRDRPVSWRRFRQELHSSSPRQEKMSMGQAILLENPFPTPAQYAPKIATTRTVGQPSITVRRGRRLVLVLLPPSLPA